MRWAVLVGLLLVGTAALQGPFTAAQGPVPQPPDLMLGNITITGPPPEWVDGVPTNNDTVVHVTVTNRGGAPTAYSLTYEWVADGGSPQPLNERPAYSTDASSVPGQASTANRINWTLQPYEKGAGRIRITAQYASATQRSAELVYAVPVHSTTLAILGAPLDLLPGERRFFTVLVENHGNVAEEADLLVLDPELKDGGLDNTQLRKELDPPILLVPGGQSRVAALYLTRAFDLISGPFTARFTVQSVTHHGLNLTAVTPTARNNDSANGFPPGYAFRLASDAPSPVFADPQAAAVVQATVQNLAESNRPGAFDDSYLITASVGNGWTVTPASQRVAVIRGDRLAVAVSVHPPSNSPPGLPGGLTLTAVSDHALPAQSIDVPLRVSGPAIQVTAIRLAPEPPYLGVPASLSVRLDNVGDRALTTGSTLRVTWAPGMAGPAPELAVPPLAAGANVTLPFALAPFSSPGPALLTAAWSDPVGRVPAARLEAPIVVHDPHMTIVPPAGLVGIPGERVTYWTPPAVFTVRNTGNAEETLYATASSDLGSARVDSPGPFVVPAGEIRSIPASVVLPLPAGTAPAANLTLSLRIAGQLGWTWNSTVVTAIVDHEAPALRLLAPLPARWTLDQPLDVVAVASDDGALDAVELVVVTPGAANRTIPLHKGGEEWSGSVTFTAAGNQTLYVRARDAAANVAWLPGAALLTARVPAPLVRFIGLAQTLDATSHIRFNVTDPIGLASLTLRSVGHDGLLQLPASGTTEADISGLHLAAGNHTLRLEAINNAGARSNATAAVVIRAPPAADQPATAAPARKAAGPDVGVAVLALLLGLGRRRGHRRNLD